jgi:hypothetical protein
MMNVLQSGPFTYVARLDEVSAPELLVIAVKAKGAKEKADVWKNQPKL